MSIVGRMAPTPSGQLHLGNVVAFAACWLSIRKQGGQLLLRIEDLDQVRAQPDIEAQIRRDLMWLGLTWDKEVQRQSERDYRPALKALGDQLISCGCSRRELKAHGGRCSRQCGESPQRSLRLPLPAQTRTFEDRVYGRVSVNLDRFGDQAMVRADGVIAYNLAVVVDDYRDGVSEVVRGADLLELSSLQGFIGQQLGTPAPSWAHAPLILGPDGRKLSKSHDSLSIAALRARGRSPEEIWACVLPWLGLTASTLRQAIEAFAWSKVPTTQIQLAPDHPFAS